MHGGQIQRRQTGAGVRRVVVTRRQACGVRLFVVRVYTAATVPAERGRVILEA